MADIEPGEGGGGERGGTFGFLGHKLFGKIPVWVVAVAAVGGYYWYTRYGPGKKAASSSAAQTTGTDPAGNTGIIDPATGYVYGSSEDSAALAAAGNTGGGDYSGGGGGGSSTGGGTTTQPVPVTGTIPTGPGEGGPKPKPVVVPFRPGVGKIGESRLPSKFTSTPRKSVPSFLPAMSGSKNTEWGGNAVSNLVSQGVPPDQASTAIQAHLDGLPLSPAMAANRDLAIDSIGPPPQVPAPGQAKAPMTAGSANG